VIPPRDGLQLRRADVRKMQPLAFIHAKLLRPGAGARRYFRIPRPGIEFQKRHTADAIRALQWPAT
jgi:hypothetical protein